MSDLVAQVKDEQSYIIVRERVHRNTAESTNARIKWWSIFQLMVLIGQGFFQVWWLKRFFEVSCDPSAAFTNETRTLTFTVGQARCIIAVLLLLWRRCWESLSSSFHLRYPAF